MNKKCKYFMFIDNFLPIIKKNITFILKSKNFDVNKILSLNEGKFIRSQICLFAALLDHHHVLAQDVYKASIIEIIHRISLIHDDVIDNSTIRHCQNTLNYEQSNSYSVLIGDFYLLTLLSRVHDEYQQKIIDIVKKMIQGELLQRKYVTINNSDILKNYYDIISLKTGYLMSKACDYNSTLEHIGMEFGICYQIFDDINDYNINLKDKKPYNDFKTKILTLPVIVNFYDKNHHYNNEMYDYFFNNKNLNENFDIEMYMSKGIQKAQIILNNRIKNLLKLIKKNYNNNCADDFISYIINIFNYET